MARVAATLKRILPLLLILGILFPIVIITSDKFMYAKMFLSNALSNRTHNVTLDHLLVPRKRQFITRQSVNESAQLEDRLCPLNSTRLVGRVHVVTHENRSWGELSQHIAESSPGISAGGRWHPSDCIARYRVAIVVPYRDREEHLRVFLRHMHQFLPRQDIDYTIYIIEMQRSARFNRALLLNIGFVEAMKVRNYDCFIFHDVDLLPEDDRNLYSCPGKSAARHLSVAVSSMNYTLMYEGLFGGVTAMTREQFIMVNGYSNMFIGWGGEDDDMYNRVTKKGNMSIARYPADIARYTMLLHAKDKPNPKRYALLNSGLKRWNQDGLNSLDALYNVVQIKFYPLYTWVDVTINQT